MLDGDRVYSLSKKGTNAAVFAPQMFRGWWSSLDHLVLNAILLGPARY